CMIEPSASVSVFLRLVDQESSEVTGPAFNPDGTRLYFSSQRGTSGSSSGGLTYEVTGPFRS
ncbi:MAG: translocation protein TolB, partial [Micromonosporaceae bacterium]